MTITVIMQPSWQQYFLLEIMNFFARTGLWGYGAYFAHNFSYDHFPVELKAWLTAIKKYIDQILTGEIKSIYALMLERHTDMVVLSQPNQQLELPISEEWLEIKKSFQADLIHS